MAEKKKSKWYSRPSLLERRFQQLNNPTTTKKKKNDNDS